MEINDVITLANNKSYALLMKSELTEEIYFLAVLLNEKEEPTNSYAVFEEVNQNGKTFVRKISDPGILDNLLADFKGQYVDEYDENPDESREAA